MSTREVAAPARSSRSKTTDTAAVERPIPSGTNAAGFGSDVVAEVLRDLDIPYIALNPGASYRGLHDSLVNHIGNAAPQMLLCLHEEAAVAIAHGYAKVTGKAMAAAVWIQSIQGRRLAASTGPVAPRMMMGMRSHQALKIAMVAWNNPTLECTAAAIALPVTLA